MNFPLDKWFGTLHGALHKGDPDDENKEENTKELVTSCYAELGVMKARDFIYFACNAPFFYLLYESAVLPGRHNPYVVAFCVSCGPVVVAMIMWAVSDRMLMRWPFHKEPVPSFLFQLILSLLQTVLPIYLAVFYFVSPTPVTRLWL
eukprot:GEMP01044782.1.p3 GENE.GEMP01044782.1~~GEMP01044782.1.p3  ORF type:complete len:147 (+),score=30.90 GEMP01044782.1:770-1210(+)